MNVRMDDALKRDGDAVFADIGLTPTEVVRMVWEFARRNRHDRGSLGALEELLRDPLEARAQEKAQAEREAAAEEWLERGPRIMRDHFERLGVDYGSVPAATREDFDKMLEAEYAEKYPELWSV